MNMFDEQPPIDPDVYTPDKADLAYNYLATGRTSTQLACHFKVLQSTLVEWAKEHPEFDKAIRLGEEASIASWEDWLYDHIKKSKNATLAKELVINRLGWSKGEIKSLGDEDGAKPLTINFNIQDCSQTESDDETGGDD